MTLSATELATQLTAILRTPTGTMSLRPLQGQVLMAAEEGGGCLFTNASVGMGKTLMLALLVAMFGGKRPLILTEARNIEQMRADFLQYRAHWKLPSYYRIESFETLSTRPELLDELDPTFLGMDEAHRTKAPPATRGKRIQRWRVTRPHVPMAVLSGTPGEYFETYAHLLVWGVPSLRSDQGGPIPVEGDGDNAGLPGGRAWKRLLKEMKESDQYRAHIMAQIRQTPGVVISSETFTDKPLRITHAILDTPDEMLPHWRRLRCTGEAPDGWHLDEFGEQWGFARLIGGAGCYYEHVPRPPEPFRAARKAWHGFCSSVQEMGDRAVGGPYDTEGQVARGVLAGHLPSDTYREWMRQLPTYNPTTKVTWLSDGPLEWAIAWGRAAGARATKTTMGAIIWTEHTGFGEELSRRTGWPYYSKGARNASRQHVRLATAPVIICSTDSCSTSHNLQRYSQGAWMNPPSNNGAAEQQIGRKHRPNQLADLVECTFLHTCLEDWCSYMKAEAAAAEQTEDLTAPRKIVLATHVRASYPQKDDDATDGNAWQKASKTVVVI